MSQFDYDAIIIGSGFGGAVTACRLAEHGLKVLVLERGRRWTTDTFPRAPEDAWLWDRDAPEKCNGWLDLHVMDDMTVAAGAGVGGGSLIYANIFVEAKPAAFDSGWPAEITFAGLQPYYKKAGDMLDIQELPDTQLNERFKLMRDGAAALGLQDRFRKLPLAVSFSPEQTFDSAEVADASRSRPFINRHGQQQGTCIHCGNCDIGCPVKAKNTLDLNYLAVAEKHGAEIRALHLVMNIEPLGSGYRVNFDKLASGHRRRGSASAARVIVAAGSMGSTDLLLRCRDQYRTLPRISSFLGQHWSSNGDFLTPAFYPRRISPTHGPTISCAIDMLDGSADGQSVFVEDGGFPNLLGDLVQSRLKKNKNRYLRHFWKGLSQESHVSDPLHNVMPWFGQGVDGGDGTLYLGRVWYAPWRRKMRMDWDVSRSEPAINALVHMHERLSAATGGKAWVPPTWSVFKDLVTPHPLGGCNMGSNATSGVVDHRGEVFGHANLFVADGSIIPRPLGLNPSRTIAALAERIAELICSEIKGASAAPPLEQAS